MATPHSVDDHTRIQLNEYLSKIENVLKADVLTIFGLILYGLENKVKDAIELFQDRTDRIAVILDTSGGLVEVVERIVQVIRHHYDEVDFLIPDQAMSAGTVFAMAGDRIFMSYFSCLGPIDPQIVKDGKLVPALSYLNQYQRLHAKAEEGELNTAELVILNKLDPGELYQFEQARQLSHDLLTDWLSTSKLKDWIDNSTGKPLSDEKKRKKAEDIAAVLSNNERWHSHGRMISRDTLINDPALGLNIKNLECIPNLFPTLDNYVGLLKDYVTRQQFTTFVHTHTYF